MGVIEGRGGKWERQKGEQKKGKKGNESRVIHKRGMVSAKVMMSWWRADSKPLRALGLEGWSRNH